MHRNDVPTDHPFAPARRSWIAAGAVLVDLTALPA